MGLHPENQSDKEIVAARESLRKGIFQLLDSRGVDAKKVFSKSRGIKINLLYEDYDYAREEIPQRLNEFVNTRYPGRKVGISRIEIGLRSEGSSYNGYIDISVAHIYPRTPEEAEGEKQRVAISDDEITGLKITETISRLEKAEDFHYFIIPDRELVLSDLILLSPYSNPMTWSMTSYSLDKWLRKNPDELTPKTSFLEKLSKNQILDRYGLGIVDEEEPLELPLNPQVASGILEAGIVLAIASIIPDAPSLLRDKSIPKFIPTKGISIY